MPIGTILQGISAGLGIAGSAVSGKSKTSTTTTTPTLSAEDDALKSRIRSSIDSTLSDPSAGLEPIRAAGQSQINRNYATMPGKVSRALSARGFGKSGKVGTAMYDVEASRIGEMSDLNSQIAQMMLQQKNTAINQGTGLLSMFKGQESSSTGSGNAVANGLMSGGNAVENIITMMMLDKVLKGAE